MLTSTTTSIIILLLILRQSFASTVAIEENSQYNSLSRTTAVTFSQSEVIIEVGEQVQVFFWLSGPAFYSSNTTSKSDYYYLHFTYQEKPGAEITSWQRVPVIRDLASVAVTASINNNGTSVAVPFAIVGLTPGQVNIGLNSTNYPELEGLDNNFVRVRVIENHWIDVVNFVVGIFYVVCWSASYYPQTWLNYIRKSVVGLNFDFVGLNILGYLVYSIFNVGLYWVQPLQAMYYDQHPGGVIPVQLADCLFSLHCLGITIFLGIQCFIYERDGQRISIIVGLLLSGMTLALLVILILTVACGENCNLDWLQFVYFASYIKLFVTLTKYAPQIYMNYKRQSTLGWSIGQVYLDFIGGFLSILQMILLAYNYSDWESLLGDPTKLGLGIVSIVYNIFFFIQHYCLYGPRIQGTMLIDLEASTNSQRFDSSVNSANKGQLEKSDEKTQLL